SADPLLLLKRNRKCIRADASVIAVVPNAQHWSMQMRLAAGDLRYNETGLLSPGQRRWFSRSSLLALLQEAGFQMAHGLPLIRHPLTNPPLEAAWRQLLAGMSVYPDLAFQDSQPDTYVIQARPR